MLLLELPMSFLEQNTIGSDQLEHGFDLSQPLVGVFAATVAFHSTT